MSTECFIKSVLKDISVLNNGSKRAPFNVVCGIKIDGLHVYLPMSKTPLVGLQSYVFCVSQKDLSIWILYESKLGLKGNAMKSPMLLAGSSAKPFLMAKITVLSNGYGLFIPKHPRFYRRSSSVVLSTSACFMELPIPWAVWAFIVLSRVYLRSLNAESLINLKANPWHSKWNWIHTTKWYKSFPRIIRAIKLFDLHNKMWQGKLLSHIVSFQDHDPLNRNATHDTFYEPIVLAS